MALNLHDNDLVGFEATAAERHANDPKVRAFALAKTMQAMDVGAEFGAKTYVGVKGCGAIFARSEPLK